MEQRIGIFSLFGARYVPPLVFFVMLSSALLADPTTPLFLNYTVTPLGGGEFDYEFTLTLDNNNGSWAPGENFNWIMFGTDAGSSTSLTDFVGNPSDLPIGPFTDYTVSNGLGGYVPTLVDQSNIPFGGWIPTAVGDELTWSGTSTADLPIGQLYWTYLENDGSEDFPDKELCGALGCVGIFGTFIAGTHSLAPFDQQYGAPQVVPEPSYLFLLGTVLVLLGLGGSMKRKSLSLGRPNSK